MKNNKKIYGIIFVLSFFIFGFFYFIKPIKADEFLMTKNLSVDLSCNANSGDFWQSFTATESNISRFILKGGDSYNGSGATTTLHIHNRATNELIYQQDFPPVAVSNNIDMPYILDNPVSLVIGQEYQLQFEGTTGISNRCSCNGCNPYAGGEWSFNNTIDLYFKVYYTDNFQADSGITITYPTNYATYNGSPVPLTFNYNNPNSEFSQIIFTFQRITPQPQTLTPVHFYTASTTTYIDNIIFKNLVNGDYKVNAYKSNWNGTPHPPATAWTYFTIASSTYDNGSANMTPIYDDVPLTCIFNISECDNISSTDFLGGIECGFKKVAIWGLCPSSEAQTALADGYNDLKNSFPFSAFFDLTDTVSQAVSSTTLNMNNTITMPFINKTGDFILIPVLASTSMPNLIGQNNYNLFRNSITWVLWCLCAFIVFITIKKI